MTTPGWAGGGGVWVTGGDSLAIDGSLEVTYVQGAEASAQGKAFLAAWLGGKEEAFAGYPFTIDPRDANPDAGTTKNWFNATYGIPAYTYEVGDESDPAAVGAAAEGLAKALVPALEQMLAERSRP